MDQEAALWRRFFVRLEGNANGAHRDFVTRLQRAGYIEVDSPVNSDFLVVFCPIVSRVGTDISEALEKIPGNKAAMLVVMHQTFNPDHVVAQSSRLVEKPNVRLTVDCLFYNGKLLDSNRNDIAWFEIQKFLGVPISQSNALSAVPNFCRNERRTKTMMAAAVLLLLILIVIILLVYFLQFK